MKKKIWILIAAAALLLAGILAFVLTDGDKEKTSDKEIKDDANKFIAEVLEIQETSALVMPIEGEIERSSADKISISFSGKDIGVKVGDMVEIAYDGLIMETYPAKIRLTDWRIVKNLRTVEYTGPWLNKQSAEKQEYDPMEYNLIISEIYSNCFFAKSVIPSPYTYKINGSLSDNWCINDKVLVSAENIYTDFETFRTEAKLVKIEPSDFTPDPNMCYKPVIYLYPKKVTDVSVKLDLVGGGLTCTYPQYNGGWNVTATPEGILTDKNGREYNYLYWEGDVASNWDMSCGFCVKGEDTAEFLEYSLEKLGLNRKEANEFIIYWLPLMQENPYNVISFQADAYTDTAKLDVFPAPDTQIRVFMTYKASNEYVEIVPQELTAPERQGFTLVEWGGSEIK